MENPTPEFQTLKVSLVIVSMKIVGDIHEVDQRIEKHLVDSGIQSLRGEWETGRVEYSLQESNGRIYGLVTLQTSEQGVFQAAIKHIHYSADGTEENDARLIRLRNEIPSLIHALTEGITQDRIIEIQNKWEEHGLPLTSDERKRIHQGEETRRQEREKQGFSKQILLDETFETKPQNLRRLIRQYIDRQREFGNHFWKLIDPDFSDIEQDEWVKELFIPGARYFTDLGKITVIQLNDNLCKITIEDAWDAIPFIAQAEADALYFEARKELKALVVTIKDSFSIDHNISSANTRFPIEMQNDLAPNTTDGQQVIKDKEPWLLIPDLNVDRKIVKLWHEGLSNSAIGDRVGMQRKSVTNRLSELRTKFGEKIVPRRR